MVRAHTLFVTTDGDGSIFVVHAIKQSLTFTDRDSIQEENCYAPLPHAFWLYARDLGSARAETRGPA